MAKIFATRKIPSTAFDKLLSSGNEVQVSEFDRILTPEELLDFSKGAEVLLCLLTDKIDGEVMDAIGPQLRMISNYAVGFDNVDIKAATERGIVVANTPCDEVNEAVAEHTWALLLSLSRRIVEADESTRRGAYKGWEPAVFLGRSLIGKTLGILGLGRIGSMVARRAKGYNMNLLYYNRSRDEKAEGDLGIQYSGLDELLGKSDFVSVHVPLTDQTRHLINKETLSKMKPGAFLVNTARGPIVEESDLVEFLRNGHLAGAGLDVYENEPVINPELVGMEQVVLTPHIASATYEAREKMGEMAVSAILKAIANEKPDNLVNAEIWDKRRK
jgi:glyoxylate reductase